MMLRLPLTRAPINHPDVQNVRLFRYESVLDPTGDRAAPGLVVDCLLFIRGQRSAIACVDRHHCP
ncbi:MAG: hypothetical protein AAFU66_06690, partial [Pseudomonadota bacterium]